MIDEILAEEFLNTGDLYLDKGDESSGAVATEKQPSTVTTQPPVVKVAKKIEPTPNNFERFASLTSIEIRCAFSTDTEKCDAIASTLVSNASGFNSLQVKPSLISIEELFFDDSLAINIYGVVADGYELTIDPDKPIIMSSIIERCQEQYENKYKDQFEARTGIAVNCNEIINLELGSDCIYQSKLLLSKVDQFIALKDKINEIKLRYYPHDVEVVAGTDGKKITGYIVAYDGSDVDELLGILDNADN